MQTEAPGGCERPVGERTRCRLTGRPPGGCSNPLWATTQAIGGFVRLSSRRRRHARGFVDDRGSHEHLTPRSPNAEDSAGANEDPTGGTDHRSMPLTITQDFRLGARMLLNYPGLTLAGGLALAIAIGIGSGWHYFFGTLLSPTIPLPEGDRLVLVETRNTLTNQPELRVTADFLEWRRELQTIEELGAYRTGSSNLIVRSAPPKVIQSAEMTPDAFRTAHVAPVLGRGLQDADAMPGAPTVVVLGYDLWQRSLGGRLDAVGSIVQLGGIPVTVVGVMPEGFAYPRNQQAWTPLQLRASYGPFEGGPLNVIGRLAADATRAQADAELRVLGERAASAFPTTHAPLRSRVMQLGGGDDESGMTQFALTNLPVLLVLLVTCMNAGTLIYARTATREGEIAMRSALGASRARIIGQLFVEALLLALVSATIGLLVADRAVRFGLDLAATRIGAPFWFTRGLGFTTVLYACGLAVAAAAMLSLLPALRATRTHLQSHLANLGAGRATLRFGWVWMGAMIVQVALTAIGIPVALESAREVAQIVSIRSEFPSADFVTARIEVPRSPDEPIDSPTFQSRRSQAYAELKRRLVQAPETVAVTFADYVPGTGPSLQGVEVESTEVGASMFDATVSTAAVGPQFFETIGSPIVGGRGFQENDRIGSARTVIVNEAFARLFQHNTGQGSPIGARVRRERAAGTGLETAEEPWYEIVGVARDIGLDPNDGRDELPYVYHAALPATVAGLAILVRVRGNAGGFAARLPIMAAAADPGLSVRASALNDMVRGRDMAIVAVAGALGGVTLLVLAMSAMGIFSLMSVGVSRRTREIGLRTALGANPRQVIISVLSRAAILMASGGAIGAALLLWIVSFRGPRGDPGADIALFVPWLAVTAFVMLATGVLAALGPARRALRINPTDALRDP